MVAYARLRRTKSTIVSWHGSNILYCTYVGIQKFNIKISRCFFVCFFFGGGGYFYFIFFFIFIYFFFFLVVVVVVVVFWYVFVLLFCCCFLLFFCFVVFCFVLFCCFLHQISRCCCCPFWLLLFFFCFLFFVVVFFFCCFLFVLFVCFFFFIFFFLFFFCFLFFSFDTACRLPPNYTNGTQWILNENLPLFKLKGCASLSDGKTNGLYKHDKEQTLTGATSWLKYGLCVCTSDNLIFPYRRTKHTLTIAYSDFISSHC